MSIKPHKWTQEMHENTVRGHSSSAPPPPPRRINFPEAHHPPFSFLIYLRDTENFCWRVQASYCLAIGLECVVLVVTSEARTG